MDFPQAKEHLRRSIKDRLMKLSPDERAAESRSICRRVIEHLPQGPLTICAFYPMPNEADLRPLLEELLRRGDTIFLPCFTRTAFEFRQLTDMNSLAPGFYKTLEPPLHAPKLDLSTLDVALVPGYAFDLAGNRLGRGNGGYDRWIKTLRAANPKAVIWGIALEAQMTRTVPMDAHDERVDGIVTARGLTQIRT